MDNQYRYGYNSYQPYNPYPSYDPQPYYSNQEDFNNQKNFQYNDQESNQWDFSQDQGYYGHDQCDYNQDQGYFSNQDGYNQNQGQGYYSNQDDHYRNEDEENYCDQDGYYQNQERNASTQEKSNLITIMNMLQSISQKVDEYDQRLEEVKAQSKMLETEIAQRNLSYGMPYTMMQDEVLDDEDEQEESTPLAATIDEVETPAQEISTPQIRDVNSTLSQFENNLLTCDDNDFVLESQLSFDEESVDDSYCEPKEMVAQEGNMEENAITSDDIIQEDISKGDESAKGKEFDGEVEMKPLPSNPRYEVLGPDFSLPIIVSKCLNETLTFRLLQVMRRDPFFQMYGLCDNSWLPSVFCSFHVETNDTQSKTFSQEGCAMKFNIFVIKNEFIRHDHFKPPKVDWKYFIVDEAQRRRVKKFILARDFEKCKMFDDWFSKSFKKEGIG